MKMPIKVLGVTLAVIFNGNTPAYAVERVIVAELPCMVNHQNGEPVVFGVCEMWTWRGRRFSTAYTPDKSEELSTVEYMPDGSQKLFDSYDAVFDEGAI